MPHVHTLTVRFRDCDQFRHVNNAVYLTYFEEARASYWKALMGSNFQGFDFILAEATCRYHAPAHFGETLKVSVTVPELGNKSFRFAYEITEQETGKLIATGHSVQVMYDYDRQASILISDELRRRIEAFS